MTNAPAARTAGLALVVALSLAACGGDDGAATGSDTPAPAAAAAAAADSGAAAAADAGAAGPQVVTDENGELRVYGAAVPDEFPSEMPLFPGAVPDLGTTRVNGDGIAITVHFEMPDADLAEVEAFYERELPAAGWEIVSEDMVGREVAGHGFEGGLSIYDSDLGGTGFRFTLTAPPG